MNENITNFKAAVDAAQQRVADMPEDRLRAKHIKGNAWTLANEDWKVTPLTDKQAGFLAGARGLVVGLLVSGEKLLEYATQLWYRNLALGDMANSATLVMSAWGACTTEKGYWADPQLLAEDLRAAFERVEGQKQTEDAAYKNGYEAGKAAVTARLEPACANAITNERDAEAVKMMTVLGDGFYLTYSKLLKKFIVSVEDGKDGKEWDGTDALLALWKAQTATGHVQIPCIYCGGTYETIQPGCCPNNPLSPNAAPPIKTPEISGVDEAAEADEAIDESEPPVVTPEPKLIPGPEAAHMDPCEVVS